MSHVVRDWQQGPQAQDPAFAAAEAAMARMRGLRLRPTPQNFAVWYAYCSGEDPALRRVLDVLLSNRRPVDQRAMEEIHDRFFGPGAQHLALRETSRRVQEAMREVIGIVTGAEAEATRYGTTLHEVSGQVVRDPLSLPAVVGRLLEETREMARRNEELGRHLARSAGRISELERKLEDARRDAATDPLTGLANRRAFDAALQEHAGAAMDSGRPLSLLMLDIDRFKQVNDTWGHQVGDAVLRLLGLCLGQSLREGDCAARIGGEEFAAILPGTTEEEAVRLADRVRLAFGGRSFTVRATGQTLGNLTLSAGVARYECGEALADFLRRADAALYEAKRTGRDRVVRAGPPGASGGPPCVFATPDAVAVA